MNPVFKIEKQPEENRSRFTVTIDGEEWLSKWFPGLNYTMNQAEQTWKWQRQHFWKHVSKIQEANLSVSD